MPKIQKVFELDVSPQKYVNACDEGELRELMLLAQDRLMRLHENEKLLANYPNEQFNKGA